MVRHHRLWIGVGTKKGIDGGAGGVIVKSLFGDKGKLGRNFPRPRFKLYDYKNYPNYPQKLPHAFTLNSLEECSHFGYKDYMVDLNKAKDEIGDKGIVMASLSGVTLEEWEEMVDLTNQTNADWVELNVSCPFAADMGVKMGAGAVDMTAEVVRRCAGLLKKPFSVKISPQTVDQSAVALACQEAGAMAVNISARFSGYDIDIDQARPIGPGAQGGWGGPLPDRLWPEKRRAGGTQAEHPDHRGPRCVGLERYYQVYDGWSHAGSIRHWHHATGLRRQQALGRQHQRMA